MEKIHKNNLQNICILCKLSVHTNKHHLTPKSKGGKETIDCCETCESYLHKTWTHAELRDTYNSVEVILATPKFQSFLKWRKKQPATIVFKSQRGKFRDKNPYH